MLKKICSLAVGLAVTATSVASAASIKSVDGHAFVSKGAGYAAATAGVQLVPGDRAMVSNNSSAVVTFEDGCSYTLLPGKVLLVQKMSPCLDASRVTDRVRDLPGRMSQSGAEAGGVGTYVLGGVIVGGAVIGAVAISNQQKKSP